MKNQCIKAAWIVFATMMVMVAGCSKPGDDSQPSTDTIVPPPPPPAEQPYNYNFGTVIDLKDKLFIYDASSGNVLLNLSGIGTLKNAARNNVTVSGNMLYQLTITDLLAVNRHTGAVVFRKFFTPTSYSFGGVSSSFPVIDGNNIFLAAYNYNGHFKLYSLNKLTGTINWEAAASISYDLVPYMPSLVQTASTILVTNHDGPACYDKATGALVWKNNSSADFAACGVYPLIAGNKMITVSNNWKKMYAFDVTTGNLLWKTSLPAGTTYVDGLLHEYNGIVYFQSNNSVTSNRTLYGADISSGAIIKQYHHPLATDYLHIYGDAYFVFTRPGTTFFPQVLTRYSLSTGAENWSRQLEGGLSGALTTTPGHIYCVETDPINTSSWEKMNIMSQQTGKTLKTFPLLVHGGLRPVVVDSSGAVYSTPH